MARCWVSEASGAGDLDGSSQQLVGFLLFDSWIVDASRTHTSFLVCVFVCSVVYR